MTYNNYACYYRKVGKLRAALSYLEKALEIEQTLPYHSSKADTHLNLCAVLSSMEKHDIALHHAQCAILIVQQSLLKAFLPKRDKATETEDQIKLNTEIQKRFKDKIAVLAIAYHNLAVEQEYLKLYNEALENFQQAQDFAERYLGPQDGLTINLTNGYLKAKNEISKKLDNNIAKIKRREQINIERQRIMTAHSSQTRPGSTSQLNQFHSRPMSKNRRIFRGDSDALEGTQHVQSMTTFLKHSSQPRIQSSHHYRRRLRSPEYSNTQYNSAAQQNDQGIGTMNNTQVQNHFPMPHNSNSSYHNYYQQNHQSNHDSSRYLNGNSDIDNQQLNQYMQQNERAYQHQKPSYQGSFQNSSLAKGLFQLPSKFPNKRILAVDIGGTLAKTAFYIPKTDPQFQDMKDFELLTKNTIPKLANGETIYLKSFPSMKIYEFIKFIKSHKLIDRETTCIHATGGGAYKYQELFEQEFGGMGVHLKKHDEMESMVSGMSFILNYAKQPAFKYQKDQGKVYMPLELTSQFPKLLISIGSGVSIIKVSDYNTFERVSGTMIGGGTLLGLANLLTGIKDFDTILELSKKGDNNNVDMLVKDIYGDKSPFHDLTGDILASSFAKVAFDNEFDGKLRFTDISKKYQKEDVLNSLVFMISFNIGQLAYLTGQLHNTNQLYFIGNYVRGHDLAMERINYAIQFMSQYKQEAQFLTFDGYLGAIGAFLKEFEDKSYLTQ